MSLIDLHIELGNANYLTEILVELGEVVGKKKRILTEMEKRKLTADDMPESERKYFDALEKKENELILDLIKAKKWLNLSDNIKDSFEREIRTK